MLNSCHKCTLSLYFVPIIAAFFTRLLSEHLIFSQFGEKKAGTNCWNHGLDDSDLDELGLIYINEYQTKTSKKQKNIKNTKKNKDSAISPEVRVVVDFFFFI